MIQTAKILLKANEALTPWQKSGRGLAWLRLTRICLSPGLRTESRLQPTPAIFIKVKTKAFWFSVALASALPAFGQVGVDTSGRTTNFGGSRPAGSGIKPSRPDEGGTAWMADTNTSSNSNRGTAVGGTSPGSASSANTENGGSWKNWKRWSWLVVLTVGGCFGVIWWQMHRNESERSWD